MSNNFFVVILLIFTFAFLVSQNKTGNLSHLSPSPIITATPTPTHIPGVLYVKRVIDGDTIVLNNEEIVRYTGIDTPEIIGKKNVTDCFAIEALQTNKSLVMGRAVRLEKDVSDKDRYGRLLRYVYISDPSFVNTDNNSPREIFVNDYLIKNGYAQVATYPPDVKYQLVFIKSQNEAKNKSAGLWSKCKKFD